MLGGGGGQLANADPTILRETHPRGMVLLYVFSTFFVGKHSLNLFLLLDQILAERVRRDFLLAHQKMSGVEMELSNFPVFHIAIKFHGRDVSILVTHNFKSRFLIRSRMRRWEIGGSAVVKKDFRRTKISCRIDGKSMIHEPGGE